MSKSILVGLVSATLCVCLSGQAQALSSRIYVSAKSGNDNGGNCGAFAAPCLTFQAAHDNVASGGEVEVLDPGDYGPLVITKSISIVNDGPGAAGILSPPAVGIALAINALATDTIVLRGLYLDGSNGAQTGVQLNSGGSLKISNCVIRGFQNNSAGVLVSPLNGTTVFSIDRTLLVDNTMGLRVFPNAGAQVSAVIDRVQATQNAFGIEIIGPASSATITRSIVSNNNTWGVLVQSQGGFARVSASEVIASHNGPGSGDNYTGSGFITTGGTLLLANSVATGNQYGVTVNSGTVQSYGNNNLRGNVAASGVNIISGTFSAAPNQ